MATGNCDFCGAFIGTGADCVGPMVTFKYQRFNYTLCASDALDEQKLAYTAGDSIKYDIVTKGLVRAGVI